MGRKFFLLVLKVAVWFIKDFVDVYSQESPGCTFFWERLERPFCFMPLNMEATACCPRHAFGLRIIGQRAEHCCAMWGCMSLVYLSLCSCSQRKG
jgi:hypothetical protein